MTKVDDRDSSTVSGCLVIAVWMLVIFFGAPVAFWRLAQFVAPGIGSASLIAVACAFACFFVGAAAWLGALVLRLALDLLLLPIRLLRGKTKRVAGARQGTIPGSWVFVPVGLVVGALCGIVIAVLSSQAGLLGATAGFAGSGLAYGLALWQAARRGQLDPLIEGVLNSAL